MAAVNGNFGNNENTADMEHNSLRRQLLTVCMFPNLVRMAVPIMNGGLLGFRLCGGLLECRANGPIAIPQPLARQALPLPVWAMVQVRVAHRVALAAFLALKCAHEVNNTPTFAE